MHSARVTLVVNGKRYRVKWDPLSRSFIRIIGPKGLVPSVWVEVTTAHTTKCRTSVDGSCSCGAYDLLQAFVKPPAKVRKHTQHRAVQWPDHGALAAQARKRGRR